MTIICNQKNDLYLLWSFSFANVYKTLASSSEQFNPHHLYATVLKTINVANSLFSNPKALLISCQQESNCFPQQSLNIQQNLQQITPLIQDCTNALRKMSLPVATPEISFDLLLQEDPPISNVIVDIIKNHSELLSKLPNLLESLNLDTSQTVPQILLSPLPSSFPSDTDIHQTLSQLLSTLTTVQFTLNQHLHGLSNESSKLQKTVTAGVIQALKQFCLRYTNILMCCPKEDAKQLLIQAEIIQEIIKNSPIKPSCDTLNNLIENLKSHIEETGDPADADIPLL